MANIAADQKLWNSVVSQAKAKYPSHRGSGLGFAAAKWASNEYKKRGGQYVASRKQITNPDPKAEAIKKKEEEKKKAKSTNVDNKYFKRGGK